MIYRFVDIGQSSSDVFFLRQCRKNTIYARNCQWVLLALSLSIVTTWTRTSRGGHIWPVESLSFFEFRWSSIVRCLINRLEGFNLSVDVIAKRTSKAVRIQPAFPQGIVRYSLYFVSFRNTGRPCLQWQEVFTSSLAFMREILAFLIRGISLVKRFTISSWLANRKMSELQDQTTKLNRQENIDSSNRNQIRTQTQYSNSCIHSRIKTHVRLFNVPLKPRCS